MGQGMSDNGDDAAWEISHVANAENVYILTFSFFGTVIATAIDVGMEPSWAYYRTRSSIQKKFSKRTIFPVFADINDTDISCVGVAFMRTRISAPNILDFPQFSSALLELDVHPTGARHVCEASAHLGAHADIPANTNLSLVIFLNTEVALVVSILANSDSLKTS